jgi:uncharacterized membrane protein YjjP (DUF1212 family)
MIVIASVREAIQGSWGAALHRWIAASLRSLYLHFVASAL